MRLWAAFAFAAVAVQIALGGWVSANYAALACVDFPACHGTLLPEMDFDHGFHFFRELGMTAEGEPLSNTALNAIHWTHRTWAFAVLLLAGSLAAAMLRRPALQGYGAVLAAGSALPT